MVGKCFGQEETDGIWRADEDIKIYAVRPWQLRQVQSPVYSYANELKKRQQPDGFLATKS